LQDKVLGFMDVPWEFENKGCSCGKEERDKSLIAQENIP